MWQIHNRNSPKPIYLKRRTKITETEIIVGKQPGDLLKLASYRASLITTMGQQRNGFMLLIRNLWPVAISTCYYSRLLIDRSQSLNICDNIERACSFNNEQWAPKRVRVNIPVSSHPTILVKINSRRERQYNIRK